MRPALGAALCLLIASCGGGGGGGDGGSTQNVSASDITGVWMGDIGYGPSTLVVDDAAGGSHPVLGIIESVGNDLNPTLYNQQAQYTAISGTIRDTGQGSTNVDLSISAHQSGLQTPNSPRDGWGEKSVTYTANFIEHQTATIAVQTQTPTSGSDLPADAEYLWTYAPEFQVNRGIPFAGNWKQNTFYRSGENPVYIYNIDPFADPLLQHNLDVSLSIDADGQISGTEVLASEVYKGLNPGGGYVCPRPCMEEEYRLSISGQVQSTHLTGHAVPVVTLSITGDPQLERPSLTGYLVPVSVDHFLLLLKNSEGAPSPYVLDLKRTP